MDAQERREGRHEVYGGGDNDESIRGKLAKLEDPRRGKNSVRSAHGRNSVTPSV